MIKQDQLDRLAHHFLILSSLVIIDIQEIYGKVVLCSNISSELIFYKVDKSLILTIYFYFLIKSCDKWMDASPLTKEIVSKRINTFICRKLENHVWAQYNLKEIPRAKG